MILQVGVLASQHLSQVNQLATDGFAYWSRTGMGRLPVALDRGLVRFDQDVQVNRVSLDHRRAPFPA
jgi:hypothetical protein